ncbi:MAG TPA: ABC transporter permease [Candidatus Angelobacter sp.]|nr:ABC transporter permease [Candidatus Angelobacter sp.]
MSTLVQDIRFGFRMLRKNPGFTLVALLALALGIGANTALFSVVYGVLLKPLPYAQGKELVVLRQDFPRANQVDVGFSVKEIQDYREQAKSLAQIEQYHQMSFVLLDGQQPDEVRAGVVSAHFFDLLGIKPYLGRFFTSADDTRGADAVLVLSYNYWMNRYGGDRTILGRHFRMNDKVHTVIGVLPPVPQYPRENDVYMPTMACPFSSSPQTIANRSARMMRAFGRLKPGADVKTGNNEVTLVASRLEQEYPKDYPSARGFSTRMDGLQDQLTHRVRPMLLVLLGTAGLVLLIACANVANLALARIMRREQEMAVRVALGAARGRLVRQLLTESTLLSLAGGALGLLLASGCVNLLVRFIGRFTTRGAEVRMSWEVLLFTLGISILTGLIFGSIPAFSQRLNLVDSLKEGTTASTLKSNRHQLRNLLVIGQVALSFMLLIAAGLMVRSFIKLQEVNAGYSPENILTANIPFNFSKYQGNADLVNFFDRVTGKLESTPGILSVAVNSGAPLASGQHPYNQPFMVEGRAADPNAPLPTADLNFASPNCFKLLGVPLISGRFFTLHDNADAPRVAIISQSLAKHYFQREDPIGHRLSGDNGEHWVKIVGVVGDVKYYGLDKEVLDTAYVPTAQEPMMASSVLIKTANNPMNYAQQVRDAVYSVDPEQPVNNIETLDEIRGDSLVQSRLTTLLLAMFAGLALAIAATGLSGVVALMVSQRTREIGIRMALGAQSTEVLRMVLLQGMRIITAGLMVGIVAALIFSRVMRALLFSTPVDDPFTFAAVALVFLAVGFIASYVPARRVTKVDPLIALRSE